MEKLSSLVKEWVSRKHYKNENDKQHQVVLLQVSCRSVRMWKRLSQILIGLSVTLRIIKNGETELYWKYQVAVVAKNWKSIFRRLD